MISLPLILVALALGCTVYGIVKSSVPAVGLGVLLGLGYILLT